MFPNRTGLIIWVNDHRNLRALEKHGNIHYVSRKMQYVVLYVNTDEVENIELQVQRLPFVKHIERSLRGEIPTEFSNTLPDKTRSYNL